MKKTHPSHEFRRCRRLASARPAAAEPAAVTVTDAAGRPVAISDPSRIVSVGGAVTEILYALGLERRIIAVDTTSVYPPRVLAEKPSVGYMRQLSPEGVLGLGPSLVLAAEGSGPKETVAVLEAASIPFVQVPDRFTGNGIVEKIRLIAQATGSIERGECLAAIGRERPRRARCTAGTDRAPAPGVVHSLVHERATNGGRTLNRGRWHHEACGGEQCNYRIRGLQAHQ